MQHYIQQTKNFTVKPKSIHALYYLTLYIRHQWKKSDLIMSIRPSV